MTWNLVSVVTPPEGVEVDTLTDSGLQQTLTYQGGLWWAPDFSMYVYYTPKFWAHI